MDELEVFEIFEADKLRLALAKDMNGFRHPSTEQLISLTKIINGQAINSKKSQNLVDSHLATIVGRIPTCNLCNRPAMFDCKTLQGSWGYLCLRCFSKEGIGIGCGVGQVLLLLNDNDNIDNKNASIKILKDDLLKLSKGF